MSWVEIKEQNEIHDKLITEARELVASRGRDGKTLNQEDSARFDAILADADKAHDTAEQLRTRSEREKVTFELPVQGDKGKEARERFLRYGETRAMSVSDDAAGGAFTDHQMAEDFINVLRPLSSLRQIATEFFTTDGNTFDYPKLADTASAALYTTGTVDDQDITTARPQFGSSTIASSVTLPWKLVRDSKVPPENWVYPALGERYGYREEYLGTLGTGSGQPQGFIIGGTNAGVTVPAAGYTYASVMNTIAAMPSRYDVDGELNLVCRRATKFSLFKLVDDNNRPIWQLGDVNGRLRPVISGIPIVENQHIAAIGAGAKSLALVNKKSVLLRTVGPGFSFAVESKPSLMSNIYVVYGDFDVRVVISSACLYVQQAAS